MTSYVAQYVKATTTVAETVMTHASRRRLWRRGRHHLVVDHWPGRTHLTPLMDQLVWHHRSSTSTYSSAGGAVTVVLHQLIRQRGHRPKTR